MNNVINTTDKTNSLKDINDILSQTDSSSTTLIREIDFKDVRKKRQIDNDNKAFHSLRSNDRNDFYKHINRTKFNECLKIITIDEVFIKCKNDDFVATLLSRNYSKTASRQGAKDEELQLTTCDDICKEVNNGISINRLSSTALRPTRSGQIVSKIEMGKQSIPKADCLKSFDAQITGNLNGYVCAKVCYGPGGHQDNVYKEMDEYCEWWKDYKNDSEEILVILIDTDLKEKLSHLKKKYVDINNIKIFNHIEFQKYLICI